MLRLDLAHRHTTEIVVIMLSWLVCLVVVISVLGIVVQKTLHPEQDLSKAGDAIFNMVSTIIGALVGFISGRAYGRREEKDRNGEPPKAP